MDAKKAAITAAVTDTIYRSCLYLDEGNWEEFLKLCDSSMLYSIRAYSVEIRKEMIYLSHNKKELGSLTEMLPKLNSDHSPLRRHASVYTVDVNEDGKTATAVTSLAVYLNMHDGINSHIDSGETRLFLVGKYLDKFKISKESAFIVDREVRLDTRRLDKGTHHLI
jgi:methanesulfonate monooxygenase small subunit